MTTLKRRFRRFLTRSRRIQRRIRQGGSTVPVETSPLVPTARPMPRSCPPLQSAVAVLVVLFSIAPLQAEVLPGDVLINDFIDSVIRHYRADGTLVRTLSGTGSGWEGAAVTPDGNVVTTRRTPQPGVNIFDADGRQVASFNTPEVDMPSDVSVFSDGTIAVNDQTNDREVVLYRPDGSHVDTWPLPIAAWGSTVGLDETLWVTWYGGFRIAQLGRDGSLLRDIPLGFRPGDMVVDPADGTLWVSHNDGARVFHLAPEGSVLGSFPVALSGSFNAIGLAPDRSLLVTSDSSSSRLLNYSQVGRLLGSLPLVSPRGTLFMTVVPAVVPEPSTWVIAITVAVLLALRFGLPLYRSAGTC